MKATAIYFSLLILTQSISAPSKKRRTTYSKAVSPSEGNDASSNTRAHFEAFDTFDDDVVSVVTNKDHGQNGRGSYKNVTLNDYFITLNET